MISTDMRLGVIVFVVGLSVVDGDGIIAADESISRQYSQIEQSIFREFEQPNKKDPSITLSVFLNNETLHLMKSDKQKRVLAILRDISNAHDEMKRDNIEPFSGGSFEDFVDVLTKLSIDDNHLIHGKYVFEDEPGYLQARAKGLVALYKRGCSNPLIDPSLYRNIMQTLVSGVNLTTENWRQGGTSAIVLSGLKMNYRDIPAMFKAIRREDAKKGGKSTQEIAEIMKGVDAEIPELIAPGKRSDAIVVGNPFRTFLTDSGRKFIEDRSSPSSWYALRHDSSTGYEYLVVQNSDAATSLSRAAKIIEEFEDSLKKANDAQAKLEAIIILLKELDLSHVFFDGNIRTLQTFLPYLTYCILGAALYLPNPNVLDTHGIEEIIKLLQPLVPKITFESGFIDNAVNSLTHKSSFSEGPSTSSEVSGLPSDSSREKKELRRIIRAEARRLTAERYLKNLRSLRKSAFTSGSRRH